MSAYELQTETMLHATSKKPSQIRGLTPKLDPRSKPALPTKRKRESICGLGTCNKPIQVKPCPESPYDKPSIFKPIRIIGRSQLPLSFLDRSPDESFAPNRLFSACIEVLETGNDDQESEPAPPKVLIARNESNKSLYAIERVQPRVFSLCRLARWLKEKDMDDLWDPLNLSLYKALPRQTVKVLDDAQWWQHAAVKTEPEERPTKRVRISMLRPKPEVSQPASIKLEHDPITMFEHVENLDTTVPEVPEMPMEPPSPQHLLETLVHQYLDAVYLSKTSLAYFAKGPITRVRAAFTSAEEGAPPTYELVSFLRSMLLSHKADEKKYHQKLPEIVKSIPPDMFSEDELAPAKPKKSKKKTKINRDGMYPQEEDIVKKWWISEMSSPEYHGEETLDQRIKRRIADLRVREALAQMILMLEIVALEALTTYKEPTDPNSLIAGNAETPEESQAAKPKKRKTKLNDIGLRLDLLVDKLCIWQSVDEVGILEFDAKSKQGDGMNKASKAGSSDRLQGFCVEVIIPFYVTRLPEQAIMISKKLGGPIPSSPLKRKATKIPTTSRKSGDPKEPDPKKARRTLARVATESARQGAQRTATPSLMRSATDTALPNGIKRETSEVPMSAIPFQRSPSNASRQSMSHFKHLKGRQIDLSGPSAATSAKLKHKQRVEDDLKDAISALKKPNRGLAAGGYADDIERRGLGSSNRSRKPATTVRKIQKDVLVSATPRVATRTKNMVERTPNPNYHPNPFVRDFADVIPSSGIRSAVPGTVQRSGLYHSTRSGVAETPSKAPTHNAAAPEIAETPTKAPNRKLFDSQGSSRRAIFATPDGKTGAAPSIPGLGARVPPPKLTQTSPVFATPAKPTRAFSAAVSETPLPTFYEKIAPKDDDIPKDTSDSSIFDALGWNDDDDLQY